MLEICYAVFLVKEFDDFIRKLGRATEKFKKINDGVISESWKI